MTAPRKYGCCGRRMADRRHDEGCPGFELELLRQQRDDLMQLVHVEASFGALTFWPNGPPSKNLLKGHRSLLEAIQRSIEVEQDGRKL